MRAQKAIADRSAKRIAAYKNRLSENLPSQIELWKNVNRVVGFGYQALDISKKQRVRLQQQTMAMMQYCSAMSSHT